MEAIYKSLSSVPRLLSLCKLCSRRRGSSSVTATKYMYHSHVRTGSLTSLTLAPVHSTPLRTTNSTCNTPTTNNPPPPPQACSHCSQQLYHHGSSSSPCASTHCTTSSQTPRRINRRTELDFEELRALQGTGDIALIDVRHPQELMNYGEIPGSVNIPLCQVKMALQLTDEEWAREFQFEKPTKGDRNIVFYARGPNASSAAVEIAHRLGFKLSRHYIGGWEEYSKQTGLPLKKPQDSFGTCGNAYQEQFDQYFL